MRKFFKFIFIVLLILVAIGAITFGVLHYKYDTPLPVGKSGAEADILACNMLTAINESAYLEARYVEWKFRNTNYKLDKRQQVATIIWSDYKVELHFMNSKKSKALKNGVTLIGEEKQTILGRAIKKYNNDSFWVLAPFKVFDKGTSRQIVELNNDKKGLLITYTSGGSTPGDSYLWKLDDNFIPMSYQMWVDIIPIGGLEAIWTNWNETKSGAKVALDRSILGIKLPIESIKIYSNPEDALVERPMFDEDVINLEKAPIVPKTKKKIIITDEMRRARLNRRYSKRRFDKDIAFIRPILTKQEINVFAENIMLLIQTNPKVSQFTYKEILAMRMRDSLY